MAWTDCSQSPQIFHERVGSLWSEAASLLMLIMSVAIIQKFFCFFFINNKKLSLDVPKKESFHTAESGGMK